MAYKFICQLSFISYNYDNSKIMVTPKIQSMDIVADVLGYRLPNQPDRIYYIYSRLKSGVEVYKGSVTSIFDTWFILTPIYLNNLVKYDFLYERDHEAQLDKEAAGIIYELI